MARDAVGRQLGGDPALVSPVEEAAQTHRGDGTSHRARPREPRQSCGVRLLRARARQRAHYFLAEPYPLGKGSREGGRAALGRLD